MALYVCFTLCRAVNFVRQGWRAGSGSTIHNNQAEPWDGQQDYDPGDIVGLELDCENGTLTAFKNGQLLGGRCSVISVIGSMSCVG